MFYNANELIQHYKCVLDKPSQKQRLQEGIAEGLCKLGGDEKFVFFAQVFHEKVTKEDKKAKMLLLQVIHKQLKLPKISDSLLATLRLQSLALDLNDYSPKSVLKIKQTPPQSKVSTQKTNQVQKDLMFEFLEYFWPFFYQRTASEKVFALHYLNQLLKSKISTLVSLSTDEFETLFNQFSIEVLEAENLSANHNNEPLKLPDEYHQLFMSPKIEVASSRTFILTQEMIEAREKLKQENLTDLMNKILNYEQARTFMLKALFRDDADLPFFAELIAETTHSLSCFDAQQLISYALEVGIISEAFCDALEDTAFYINDLRQKKPQQSWHNLGGDLKKSKNFATAFTQLQFYQDSLKESPVELVNILALIVGVDEKDVRTLVSAYKDEQFTAKNSLETKATAKKMSRFNDKENENINQFHFHSAIHKRAGKKQSPLSKELLKKKSPPAANRLNRRTKAVITKKPLAPLNLFPDSETDNQLHLSSPLFDKAQAGLSESNVDKLDKLIQELDSSNPNPPASTEEDQTLVPENLSASKALKPKAATLMPAKNLTDNEQKVANCYHPTIQPVTPSSNQKSHFMIGGVIAILFCAAALPVSALFLLAPTSVGIGVALTLLSPLAPVMLGSLLAMASLIAISIAIGSFIKAYQLSKQTGSASINYAKLASSDCSNGAPAPNDGDTSASRQATLIPTGPNAGDNNHKPTVNTKTESFKA